jgi:hypothetical protein
MIVIAAIALRRATVIVVVTIARGRTTAAVAFEEPTPTDRAIAIATRTIAGSPGISTKVMSFVIVAIAITGWPIGTAEASARAIAIAESGTLGTEITFDEPTLKTAFEVTFETPSRRAIGTGAMIGGNARSLWRWRRHVFVDEISKGHELSFAQFAIAIFIEL